MVLKRKKIDLEMVKGLMDESYCLIYVDYRENLDNNSDVLRKCLENKSPDCLYESFDEWYQNTEDARVDDILEDLKKELVGLGFKKWEAEKYFEENRQEVLDEIYSRAESDSVQELIKNTSPIPVRVELVSNYDCINSHWLESQNGYSYKDSYFGDMVDALNLNPARVKRLLLDKGEKVHGRFPDRKYRDGKEQVSYEDFYQELINTSCGANLLTYMATIAPTGLYESRFNISKIIIPKGNNCGIYSSMQGGGSVLEMELLKDVTINLGKTKYPYFRLHLESEGKNCDYSIRSVYGVCNSFYGNTLKLNPVRING